MLSMVRFRPLRGRGRALSAIIDTKTWLAQGPVQRLTLDVFDIALAVDDAPRFCK